MTGHLRRVLATIRRHRELLLPCLVAAILGALVVRFPRGSSTSGSRSTSSPRPPCSSRHSVRGARSSSAHSRRCCW